VVERKLECGEKCSEIHISGVSVKSANEKGAKPHGARKTEHYWPHGEIKGTERDRVQGDSMHKFHQVQGGRVGKQVAGDRIADGGVESAGGGLGREAKHEGGRWWFPYTQKKT